MLKSIVSAAAVFAVSAGLGIAVAPTASAQCDDSNWTWPECHWSAPSIPSFDLGGPRPPLTPKDSPWCSSDMVFDNNILPQRGHYMLVKKVPHHIKFWPDYVTRVYDFWTNNNPVIFSSHDWTEHKDDVVDIDCDT